MRPYEVSMIVSPMLTPEDSDKVAEKVQGILTSTGGEIVKVDRWGKRRLAYPVAKQNEGYYYIVNLQGTPEGIAEAKRQIKLTLEVLRFMFVRL